MWHCPELQYCMKPAFLVSSAHQRASEQKKVIAFPSCLMYFCVQTKCKKALACITHCLDQCGHGQLKSTEELWSCESQCQDHKLHNWKQIRSPCVASYESLCWDHYNFDRLHWRTTVMSHGARTTLRAVCLISKLPAAMILTLDNDPKTNTKKLP